MEHSLSRKDSQSLAVAQVNLPVIKINKPKSFCTTKETISKVARQPSEWEKIIPNETTDKN